MPVELSHLMQLVSGQKSSLPVGDLPRAVAKHLGCHPAIVYLGHKEVLKIVRKHPEISVEELQCLPFAIAQGEYHEDTCRAQCVTIFYNEPTKSKLYIIGVKSACSGGEAWIQSFYRTTPDKSKNKRQHKLLCKAGRRASLG
jgi:hypothetical protein